MKPETDRLIAMLGLAGALLLAQGCDRATHRDHGNAGTAPVAKEAAPSPNLMLQAAAEPFEAITEQAFDLPWAELDQSIDQGRKAIARIRRSLPPEAESRIYAEHARLEKARVDRDRLALALASVEIYRSLVEAQDRRRLIVPVDVGLLDYSGFRYGALTQASRPDWAAMHESVRFANDRYKAIEPSIRSGPLKNVTARSILAMDQAVAAKDLKFARSAAATELAIVDLLEEYFAADAGQKKA